MLKLVSNRNGVEIHQLEVTQDGCTITPSLSGVVDIIKDLNCDKRAILNALSQFNPEYVWAVTYQDPPVPVLTRRQFMRVLVSNGFDLDIIEAKIRTIEDIQEQQLALIDWRDATEFERSDKTLLMMIDLLSLTSDQVDALWSQALNL